MHDLHAMAAGGVAAAYGVKAGVGDGGGVGRYRGGVLYAIGLEQSHVKGTFQVPKQMLDSIPMT